MEKLKFYKFGHHSFHSGEKTKTDKIPYLGRITKTIDAENRSGITTEVAARHCLTGLAERHLSTVSAALHFLNKKAKKLRDENEKLRQEKNEIASTIYGDDHEPYAAICPFSGVFLTKEEYENYWDGWHLKTECPNLDDKNQKCQCENSYTEKNDDELEKSAAEFDKKHKKIQAIKEKISLNAKKIEKLYTEKDKIITKLESLGRIRPMGYHIFPNFAKNEQYRDEDDYNESYNDSVQNEYSEYCEYYNDYNDDYNDDYF